MLPASGPSAPRLYQEPRCRDTRPRPRRWKRYADIGAQAGKGRDIKVEEMRAKWEPI